MRSVPFRVKCIDDSPHIFLGNKFLVKDKIYHVIRDYIGENRRRNFILVEDNNLLGWMASRFRIIDDYPNATKEILKDFNPDKKEQEVFNPIPQTQNS